MLGGNAASVSDFLYPLSCYLVTSLLFWTGSYWLLSPKLLPLWNDDENSHSEFSFELLVLLAFLVEISVEDLVFSLNMFYFI